MKTGIDVTLGDKKYTIPALNFRQLRELSDDIAILEGMKARPTVEQQDAVERIVHAAISRNYPDVTAEEIADLLDLGNITTVIEAIMGVSGLVKKEGTGEA